jgi:cellobiose phosphorylase
MKRSFGYFQNEGTEFVVTDPNTPRALVNYSWNKIFISGLSQHGGGNGVYKERAIQYIDQRGRTLMIREGHRYFYLRDHDSGTLWSPGWHPVQLRWFVPEEDPCEIWTVTITNRRDREAHLSFYTFVDWLLQGYPSYSDYYSWIWGEYYEDIHAVQGCNRAIERPHEVFDGFVASDLKPSGFDTSRRRFLGNFGPINYPEAIRDGKCRNSLACNEKLIEAG